MAAHELPPSRAHQEDAGFEERLRSIRALRRHWEERLASEGGPAPAPAASPRDAGRSGAALCRSLVGDQPAEDPEALLTEAIRLTTLAQPP